MRPRLRFGIGNAVVRTHEDLVQLCPVLPVGEDKDVVRRPEVVGGHGKAIPLKPGRPPQDGFPRVPRAVVKSHPERIHTGRGDRGLGVEVYRQVPRSRNATQVEPYLLLQDIRRWNGQGVAIVDPQVGP